MSIFDKIGKGIKKAAKDVGHGVKDAANTVGHGVEDAANDVAKGAEQTGKQIAKGGEKVGKDIGKTATDVSKGRSPFSDIKHLAEDTANAVAGTTETVGDTVISVGNTAYDSTKHSIENINKSTLVVYRDAKQELTTVINATEDVAEWAGHEIEVGAKYVIDEAGKVIEKTLDYLEKTLMNELQKLFNQFSKEITDTAAKEIKSIEDKAVKGLTGIEHKAAQIVVDVEKKIQSAGEDAIHKVESEIVQVEDKVEKAVQHAVGDVIDDFDKVKSAVLKLEHDAEKFAKGVPKFVKHEALTILEEIGLTIAKESLKAIYSVANAYRKALKKVKAKSDLAELVDVIDNMPLSINIGPVGVFYQSFSKRADQICEVLLKYHHHPPPLKRANILEMVEALEPDFGMIDLSISGSFVIVNSSLLKFDLQAPFIDKKLIKYVLNEIMKAAGVPAGDMSILQDDGLGDLGLDDTDLNFDDLTTDVTDDSTPDSVDSTYDPNTPLVGDDSDDPSDDDLPEISDAEIDDILNSIDDSTS